MEPSPTSEEYPDDTYNDSDDFQETLLDFGDDDHKRKKGKYKYCSRCESLARESSSISFVSSAADGIYLDYPLRPPSLDQKRRWEILHYRTSTDRPMAIKVPYYELVKGKCSCSRCIIDLEGNLNCDWPQFYRDPDVKVKVKIPKNASSPAYIRVARARPEFAIVPQSELVEILRWPEFGELFPLETNPLSERGKSIFRSLKKVYHDRLESQDEGETEFDFKNLPTGEIAEDDDDGSDDREWVLVFMSKNVKTSCWGARNYFVRKLKNENIPIIEIEVAIKQNSGLSTDDRKRPCTCRESRTSARIHQHDRLRKQKGENKWSVKNKKEIVHNM